MRIYSSKLWREIEPFYNGLSLALFFGLSAENERREIF